MDHPDHDAADTARLDALATELDLLRTGSSDYHGANKTIELGRHTTAPDQYEALVARASGVPVLSAPAGDDTAVAGAAR